ncbi:MAG: family 16 glycoside hydrolase [Verrucomicrobiota bacterium]
MKSLIAACCLFAATFASADEWITLFNGENFDGWTQKGGEAKYTIEDGVIVGTTVPKTPNSFLCTEKRYGDFILELEFKVDPELNCGVQIRSNSLADYKDGRVHGYQVEIDPSDRGWSGGIYDEARRGWLDNHVGNPAARYAFKQNEWNHYRIEAVGPHIRTYINGVLAADLLDAMTLEGFIGLQVHGVGSREDPLQVRYRNIRIQDLGKSEWEPLFNGEDFSGWSTELPDSWSITDGILRGRAEKSEKRHAIFLSDESYDDFTIRVRYRAHQGNSGLYFRCEPKPEGVAVNGFQAEIDAAGRGVGGLYETGGRKWVAKPTPEAIAGFFKPDDWNVMDVTTRGGRITVHVNGVKSAEVFDDPGRSSGQFGLQLHGNQDMDVEFASVELLSIPTELRPKAESASEGAGETAAEGAEFQQLGSGYKFTEGPALGPDGKIYFNDIPNERTHVYDPETGQIEVFRESTGRANGLFFVPGGAMLACEGGNRRVTRILGDAQKTVVEKWEGSQLNSPNDLVPDGTGGFYFTDPRYGKRDDMELAVEAVYYVDRKGKLSQVDAELVRPNGIIASPDESVLYVADQADGKIFVYDILAPGKVANKRLLIEHGSDGLSVDTKGNIYLTWEGDIIVVSPAGEEVRRLTPPEKPANCLLVGNTLYVTARTGFYSIELLAEGVR